MTAILYPFSIKSDSTIDVADGNRLAQSMVVQVLLTRAKSPRNLGEYHPEPEFGSLLYTLESSTQPLAMTIAEGKGYIADAFRKWLPGFSQISTVQKIDSDIIFRVAWSYKTFTGEVDYTVNEGVYDVS